MGLIDADAIIQELREDIDVYRGRGDGLYVDGVIHGLNVAISEAREAKQIDDTVRHCKWKHAGRCRLDLDAPDEVWECSECHFTYDYDPEGGYKHCPNCGAKMDVCLNI